MSEVNKQDNLSTKQEHTGNKCMISRRRFLLSSGAVIGATQLVSLSLLPGTASANVDAQMVEYPRKKIANLSDLKENKMVTFNYPDELTGSTCGIVRTGIECGGGVGNKKDIVAFSAGCTHQGGPLQATYKATDEHRTLGQCPFHLSVFDLRRHGIIVSGQAYESLPQILLEIEGNDVYAVGVLGLMFGRNTNLINTNTA
jgi:arsenite oxidase small subunit